MPPRSQPLPRELHTPQPAPGCVAHKKTVGCPTLVAGGTRRLHGATARVRHAFSASRHPLAMPTHTHSLTAAHGPPCAAHPPSRAACTPSGRASHPRVSLRVPALHPPFSRQCTRPASSHGEAAPPTARHSHCTAACSSLPTARKQVAKKPRSPVPVGVPLCPSHGPFAAPPSGAAASPQRAAPRTPHRSHKTSRHPRPPVTHR